MKTRINKIVYLTKSYFGYPVGQAAIVEDETTSFYCIQIKDSKHKILVDKKHVREDLTEVKTVVKVQKEHKSTPINFRIFLED